MKKLIALLIILALAISGCGKNEPAPKTENQSEVSKNSEISEEIPSEPQQSEEETPENSILYIPEWMDIERDEVIEYLESKTANELYNEFVALPGVIGLVYDTWYSAEEVDTKHIMAFYHNMENGFTVDHTELETADIPEDRVESYLMSYFEVSPEYLRTAENYNPETKTYYFDPMFGVGGLGHNLERIDWYEEDTYVFIMSEDPEVGSDGHELVIKFESPTSYKYIAQYRTQPETNPAIGE